MCLTQSRLNTKGPEDQILWFNQVVNQVPTGVGDFLYLLASTHPFFILTYLAESKAGI